VLVESRAPGDETAANRIRREVIAKVLAAIEVRSAQVRVLPPGSLPKTRRAS
jgi:fatty-acyl-CoA synthase